MRASLICFALLAAGCTHGTLDLSPPGSTPTPTPTATPTGTSTPTPTPVATPLGTGNGQDGALAVTTSIIVNTCHVVTVGTGSTLAVDSAAGFANGDAVLVTQMQEPLAAPSGGAGNVGDSGVWELGRISTVGGTTLSLVLPLANGFHSAGEAHAQVCSVPEYTDLTIEATGAIAPAPWDGTSGGVVTVLVNGTLTVDGVIDVNGAGFRGGATPALSNSPHQTALDIPLASGGGGKGESIDGRAYGMGGRGNIANGGGGGNPYVAGGAGGGNGGVGGSGGLEFKDVSGNPDPETGGIGGVAIAATARAWHGGGGGAGAVNVARDSFGGAGGGVVLIVVNALAGSGVISANGINGDSDTTDKVASGGGGAGGSVLVIGDATGFTGTVTATGGNGGSCTQDGAGPGGGGGGGRVYAPMALPNATIVLTGGVNGIGGSNGARGATAGTTGIVEP